MKAGAAADRLFSAAGKKYEAALKIKPDFHEALKNWGAALLDQAEQKEDSQRNSLLTLAVEKFHAAESLVPGSGSYNLACGHALLGDEEKCKKWLNACLDTGKLPGRDHLQNDTDLDSVRNKQWFKKLIASLE